MEELKIAAELRTILSRKKLNKNDERALKDYVVQLLNSTQGIESLRDFLTRKSGYHPKKDLCEHVVNLIQSGANALDTDQGSRTAISLLTPIARDQRVSVPAKWKAIRLIGDLQPKTATALLEGALETMKPRSKVVENYEKYAKNYMGPDAGLTSLQLLRNEGYHREWFVSLIGTVNRWVERRQHISSSETSLGKQNSDMPRQAADLPSPSSMSPAKSVVDISNLRRILLLLEVNIPKLLENLKNFETQENSVVQLNHRVERLQKDRAKLEGRSVALQRVKAQLQKELETTIKAKDDLLSELEKVRALAKQDVALARDETKNAVKTFKHNLWQRVHTSFTDVMESHTDLKSCSKLERLLIRRLQNTLETLREMDVAPKSGTNKDL